MTPDDESINDVMSMSMSIHIPWDILNEHSHYKCPTAVNIELSPKGSPRRSRRPSHSTKGQGQLAKGGSDRRMTWTSSSNDPTASASSCLSQKPLSSLRSTVGEKMEDSESSGQNNFQDLIEMVAAANEHVTDYTDPSDLPELRTSPCHFHCRQNQPAGHLSPHHTQRQYLYASTYHAGGCSPRSTVSKRSGSGDQIKESLETRIQTERSKLFQQDLQNGQNQTYSKPALPQPMTSKDFIKSWLQHGSHPSGGRSHFPEVITPPSKAPNHHNYKNTHLPPRPFNSNHTTTNNNSNNSNNNNNNNSISISNNNNKQILAPISQTVKNKRQKK